MIYKFETKFQQDKSYKNGRYQESEKSSSSSQNQNVLSQEEVKYISEPNYDGFVVIGAGLPRTGTNSLQIALSHLLKGPIHHMHVVHHTGDQDAAFWIKAADGKVTTQDWKAFMIPQGYRGAVDFPAAAFYKELMLAFPNAKVILTVRDPSTWYDSVKNSIYRGFYEGYSFPTWYYNLLTGQSTRLQMVEKLCRRGGFYGFKGKKKSTICLKITQNVAFQFLNFGIFHQFLSY